MEPDRKNDDSAQEHVVNGHQLTLFELLGLPSDDERQSALSKIYELPDD